MDHLKYTKSGKRFVYSNAPEPIKKTTGYFTVESGIPANTNVEAEYYHIS